MLVLAWLFIYVPNTLAISDADVHSATLCAAFMDHEFRAAFPYPNNNPSGTPVDTRQNYPVIIPAGPDSSREFYAFCSNRGGRPASVQKITLTAAAADSAIFPVTTCGDNPHTVYVEPSSQGTRTTFRVGVTYAGPALGTARILRGRERDRAVQRLTNVATLSFPEAQAWLREVVAPRLNCLVPSLVNGPESEFAACCARTLPFLNDPAVYSRYDAIEQCVVNAAPSSFSAEAVPARVNLYQDFLGAFSTEGTAGYVSRNQLALLCPAPATGPTGIVTPQTATRRTAPTRESETKGTTKAPGSSPGAGSASH